MTANTNIEWADHTFNPWEGCQKVGPGCDHCYAEARNARFGGGTAVNWGPGAPRRRTSAANWAQPLRWNKQRFMQCSACGWRGAVAAPVIGCGSCGSIGLDDTRARVFCASLADVFDNEVDPAWRIELFNLIQCTPNLDWLVLTKRIGNANKMMYGTLLTRSNGWTPPSHLWLGATVVNQKEADRDIPQLLLTPAAKHFVSMEPLLSCVDLTELQPPGAERLWIDALRGVAIPLAGTGHAKNIPSLDWVIVGGESGPNARPMHPDWARSLRDQCEAAGVPFLFKQWGQFAPITWFDGPDADADNGEDFFDLNRTAHMFLANDGRTWDTNGGQWMYPPLPLGHWCLMGSVGKKAAGRLLDGREWNGVPS